MATATKSSALSDEEETQEQESGMDKGTILGILAGVCLIVTAIIRGGSADVFVNLNAVFIVVGGTVATAFIAFPSKKISGMIPIIINAFKPDVHQPSDYIDEIMALVTKYRSGGMKGLENEAMLCKAIRLGVIGIHDRLNPQKFQRSMNSLLPPDQQR